MKIKTPWNGGEIGTIPCTLSEVALLRLLKSRAPNLRIVVEMNGGKRHTTLALGDIDLSHQLLAELNKDALPCCGDVLPLTPAHLDGLYALGKRSAG